MIKNFVFDIGNVILSGSPKDVLDTIDIDYKSKKLLEDVYFNNSRWIDMDLGNLNASEYFEIVKKDIPDNLISNYKDILLNSHKYRKYNKNIINLIKRLKESHNIYILSDINIDYYNYLKESELGNYINGWVVSSAYGELKQNEKIFQILFDKYKLNPEECFFIDDKFINVEIARKLGMKAFNLDWINNSYQDLLNDLNKYNIKI